MAIIVYWLWFILDCSDGEVARHTKTFSQYGTQLDWIAHLVCHPLMVLACWISFQQSSAPHFYWYTIMSILLVAVELIRRQLIAFDTLLSASTNMGIKPTSAPPLYKWIVTQFLYFPNFVLLFPFLYVTSYCLHWEYIIYIYIGWAFINCLFVIRDIIRYTLFFHNN
jgi:phosphatidylglycerophosphate synthase